ncbi:hypothetical protein [Ralstonia insidiosa]
MFDRESVPAHIGLDISLLDSVEVVTPNLCPQGLDLRSQELVLFHLAFQKLAGQSRFFRNAARRKNVDVAEFILGLTEVLDLNPPLFRQSFDAVIQTANAYAQFFRKLALSEVRIFLQYAHDPKVRVFLYLGLATRHGMDPRLICLISVASKALLRAATNTLAPTGGGGVKVIYRPRLFEVEQFYLDPVTWSTVEQALA